MQLKKCWGTLLWFVFWHWRRSFTLRRFFDLASICFEITGQNFEAWCGGQSCCTLFLVPVRWILLLLCVSTCHLHLSNGYQVSTMTVLFWFIFPLIMVLPEIWAYYFIAKNKLGRCSIISLGSSMLFHWNVASRVLMTLLLEVNWWSAGQTLKIHDWGRKI